MKNVQGDKLFVNGDYYGPPSEFKRWKRRYERRRAKRQPDCGATYRNFRGWYWCLIAALLLCSAAFAGDEDAVRVVTSYKIRSVCVPPEMGSYGLQPPRCRKVEEIQGHGCAVCIGSNGAQFIYLSCGHVLFDAETKIRIGSQPGKGDFCTGHEVSCIASAQAADCVPLAVNDPKEGDRLKLIGMGGGRLHVTTAVAIDAEHGTSAEQIIGGDSGGAVLNEAGELCGILYAFETNTPLHACWTPVSVVRCHLTKWGREIPTCGGHATLPDGPIPDTPPKPVEPQPAQDSSAILQRLDALQAQIAAMPKCRDGKDGMDGLPGIPGSPGPTGRGIKAVKVENNTLYVQFTDKADWIAAGTIQVSTDPGVIAELRSEIDALKGVATPVRIRRGDKTVYSEQTVHLLKGEAINLDLEGMSFEQLKALVQKAQQEQ